MLDLKPDEQQAAPGGPDQNNHDHNGRGSEYNKLLEQLKKEAQEVKDLQQQCLEARDRIKAKENSLGHHSISNSCVPKSSDRTERLLEKKERLENL